MGRECGMIVAFAVVFSCAGVAAGSECGVCANYHSMGTFQTVKLVEAGVVVTARNSGGGVGTIQVLDDDDPPSGWGLGVVDGVDPTFVDGTEVLRVEFDGFAGERVMFVMGTASDSDGDGLYGEAWLTGLAPNGDPLGTVKVHSRTRGLADLFDGSSLDGFEITPADGDRFRVGAVCYVETEPVTIVDYTDMGTYQSTLVFEGGVSAYGWDEFFPQYLLGTVQVTENKGLGVVGGVFDGTLDGTEELDFRFEGFQAQEAWLRIGGTDVDGDGKLEAVLQVWAHGGWGVSEVNVARSGTGVVYVSSRFNHLPLDRIWIRAEDGDRLTVRQIVFTKCPASLCEADMDGDDDTDVFDFGVFALDFGCGTD